MKKNGRMRRLAAAAMAMGLALAMPAALEAGCTSGEFCEGAPMGFALVVNVCYDTIRCCGTTSCCTTYWSGSSLVGQECG